MPHINRIRVNNVKYNFGTQFYDDFIMRFSGQNTIYDLANGGGKSVLMLLLLQNMIPNCTLDEKQPIEKLFRSGNDNQTIHSLVEWKLNPSDVRNGFVYMTTGFCARKARDSATAEESGRETAPIEYFNYCIFYREANANDLVHLPLAANGERMTYQGLKNYLRDLARKDYSLQIELFDRKGDYQRFVTQYGIYESEWEIIRGINRTEGHVRTYFETHYKTTRKVVEDLFIEEIIEKSFRNRSQNEEESAEIARTLLDIKDKLVELARKKGELEHYDRQAEVLEAFEARLQTLLGLYGEKAQLEEKLIRTWLTTKQQRVRQQKWLEEAGRQAETFLERKKETQKELDNCKLQVEETFLQDIEQEVVQLEKINRQAELTLHQKETELNLQEAANDYYEYLENCRQMEIQNEAISNLSSHKGDLLEELQQLAATLRLFADRQLQQLQTQKESLDTALQQSIQQRETADIQNREMEKTQAVLENEKRTCQEQVKELSALLETKRQQSGLSFVDGIAKKKAESEVQHRRVASTLESLREQLTTLLERQTENREKRAANDQKCFLLEEQMEQEKARITEQTRQDEKRSHLEELYGERGSALYEKVMTAYEEKLALHQKLQAQMEEERVFLEALREQQPEPLAPSLKRILDYVNRHYDEQAMAGSEYLMKFNEQERQELLEQYPFLCQSILLAGNLEELSFDQRLSEKAGQEEPVILVSIQDIHNREQLYRSSRMCMVTQNRAAYYDRQAFERELQKRQQDLEKKEQQMTRLQESINVLREDCYLLASGEHTDSGRTMDLKERYEQQKRRYRQTIEEQEQFHVEFQAVQEKLQQTRESIRQQEEEAQHLSDRTILLGEMEICFDQFTSADRKLTQIQERLRERTAALQQTGEQLAHCQEREKRLREQSVNVGKRVQEWQERRNGYLLYDTADKQPCEDCSFEETEQAFLGRKLAFEEKNADVTDKKRLLDLHRSAMEKNLASINYRKVPMEQLKELDESHRLKPMSMEQLQQEKNAVNTAAAHYSDTMREYTHRQSEYDRQQGSVLHAKKLYEETYASQYQPIKKGNMQRQEMQLFIKEGGARLAALEKEEKGLLHQLKEAEKEVNTLEMMQQELERIVEQYEINITHDHDVLEEQSLKETYRTVRKEYVQLSAREQKRREEFDREKKQLMETLRLLDAAELAEEVDRSLPQPKSLEQVQQYRENIRQTVSLIQLEKERIGQGIENMEIIKDHFENQCLQTCLSIREALERLPKLSTICLDDRQVSMINLQIPYVEESAYKETIGRYIDQIVNTTDSFGTEMERLQYIRSQLAWKRLFSVIVKDMDHIHLQLYKRERMKEQSRYLKYEEAVGSTGQSQGIYIQFLVAVINYISNMNSSQVNAATLRKVIFIDNPFGAAKDTYIWEPIFGMLKSNHVQLIVPARGATPAITGRFAVNYILGQKLVGSRQQTVVVDYRSQVDEEVMEYKELDFTQQSFEFV